MASNQSVVPDRLHSRTCHLHMCIGVRCMRVEAQGIHCSMCAKNRLVYYTLVVVAVCLSASAHLGVTPWCSSAGF
jgi:hypothetical protein